MPSPAVGMRQVDSSAGPETPGWTRWQARACNPVHTKLKLHSCSSRLSSLLAPVLLLAEGGGLLLSGGQLGLAVAEVGLQVLATLGALLHLALQPCQRLPAAGQAGLQLLRNMSASAASMWWQAVRDK